MGQSASSTPPGLFQVYLRLRPPPGLVSSNDRFITVEPPASDAPSTAPTRITLDPPNDRRRAIEKFAFTQVFEEDASQLDVFHCTNILPLVEGILAPHGGEGTDALLATLGVTGSGKSHTILGSRSQRGLTQLALDVLFRSIGNSIADIDTNETLHASIESSDVSEASCISCASDFIEAVYRDAHSSQPVRDRNVPFVFAFPVSESSSYPGRPESHEQSHPRPATPKSVRIVCREDYTVSSPLTPDYLHLGGMPAAGRHALQAAFDQRSTHGNASPSKHYMSVTASAILRKQGTKNSLSKGDQPVPPTPRRPLSRPSALPQTPDISTVNVPCDPAAEYVVLVSMYEVYNDRIFDLLTPPVQSAATKEFRRRPLLFKPTELSPDRKVVAGLRKIVCCSLTQALMVVEAGLHERRVAGTSSNSVSSRSHGFFNIEVKKRKRTTSKRLQYPWSGSALTIVDLAGSERARDAKTAGATLAEAGKINESLMYLGQCLQMQSDSSNYNKPNVVPFRQCKLTELLFSNSFPNTSTPSQSQSARRHIQKAIMIVTADARGDFNATSQILRYSALAREVAVPRIPSITETILQTCGETAHPSGPEICASLKHILSPAHKPRCPPFLPAGNVAQNPKGQRSSSPVNAVSSEDRVMMEHAALEIARLAEDNRCLHDSLEREQDARLTAEAHLLSMQDRILDLEQAIREDCAAEFEQRLAVELSRWKEARQTAIERGEEHWDRKMEVFERSLTLQSAALTANKKTGVQDKENVLIEPLEEENTRLRREVVILKREFAGRSPSKRVPLLDREDFMASANSSPRSVRSLRMSRHAYDGRTEGDIMHRKMEDLTLGDANSGRANSKSRTRAES